MTLTERIKEASPDEVFFVGSASSFVFIGNSEEYFKDIESISKLEYAHFRAVFDADVSKLIKYNSLFGLKLDLDEPNEIDLCALDDIAENCGLAIKGLRSFCRESSVKWIPNVLGSVIAKLSDLRNTCNSFSKDKDLADHFIPFENRTIVQEYPRIDEGTALIVDGYEIGKYWLHEEYKAKEIAKS